VADCRPFEAIAKELARLLDDCDLARDGLKRFDLPLVVAEFCRAVVHFPLAVRAVVDVLLIFTSAKSEISMRLLPYTAEVSTRSSTGPVGVQGLAQVNRRCGGKKKLRKHTPFYTPLTQICDTFYAQYSQ
jgi:hypothetical protein